MKVAFHAINGVGLGHLVRAVAIAEEIRALVPAAELLVLTNAKDTAMLTAARLDFVRFPPRLDEPHADPTRVHVALPPRVEEAAFFATLAAFAPDLVVFDTHPPLSIVARLASIGARAVLVQRELRPDALRSFVASGAPLLFDRIVVPHDPGEVGLEPYEGAPVVLVGPIVRALPPRGVGERAQVVAVGGGGGQPVDAARYFRAVADAHLLARARVPALETVLVTGPYGAPPDVRYDGLTVLRTASDLASLLAGATLVVSQAGYNAVAELRALKKPAILVPAYRKAEDQRLRAQRLARVGAAVLARPEARSIADRLERLLLEPGALAAMSDAHARLPLAPKNRAAAEAVLSPIWRARQARPSRVVLVAHDFAPKLGGMETVARSLARELLARGVEVKVYTTKRLGARIASGLGEGVVVPLYTPLAPPGRIDLRPDLHLTIDRALRDVPDVIHLCNAGLGPWIPDLRAALPATVTCSVHGNDLLAPWVTSGDEPAAYRAAQIAGLSAADAVVAVSEFSRRLAETNGVDPRALHTVENGVDARRFAPGPRDARLAERLGLAPDDEVILTVSRLAPRKGHRTVIQALAKVARPRLKYIFTGASEAMTRELLDLAREKGVASRVVPAGFVGEDELPSLYRLASAFALLADEEAADVEGFGVALLEAAASGLPTIASRTGGMPEAIADGITGLLIPPGDATAAAEAITSLLRDPARARRLGEAGRVRVEKSFSEAAAATRLLALWSDREARAVTGGAELVRLAQRHAQAEREERQVRRRHLRTAIDRGQIVRLRATADGARRLPDALEDCALLGHAPRVEVKLRRFLEADFATYALPSLADVELVHGVPHPTGAALFGAVQALSPAALAKVKTLRLFLTEEARHRGDLAVTAVPETHALRRFFASRGAVVVPPPELMRYLSETPAGGPDTAMIEPTNLCNLTCPTCPTGTGKIKPLPQMTLARFDVALDALKPRLRNLALWNYGEPLLNRELPAMIARAKEAGVGVVKVSSNVHFLDGARGRALLESGLDVLILSVDGASQATYETFRRDGDFAKVATSVAWLCAEKQRLGLKKPRIELQFIAMRHNEHELPEMHRLASEWGVDALRVKTVGAEDDATKNLVPVTRLLSRYEDDATTPNIRHPFCTMAWDHTVVNVDGSVTPCCYLRPDMGDEFVMGNVFDAPFASIWRGERYRAFRASMLKDRSTMPVCNRCRGGTHDLIAATHEVSRA
ncbi:MAG: glycosyltransferase [Labilithrix sp.]